MRPRACRALARRVAAIAPLALSASLLWALPAPADSHRGGTEYVEVAIAEALSADAILDLLDRSLGESAASGSDPVALRPLRGGVFLTATPLGPYVVLRFETDRGGQTGRETMAEVAVPADFGRTFGEIVEVALRTAQGLPAQVLQPWELQLKAENPRGGEVVIRVEGGADGEFSLAWVIEGPLRPIDRYRVPTAFRSTTTSRIGGTVHFPLLLEQFTGFVDRAYGRNAPDRFTDFQLFPHRWLRLTVTGDGRGEGGTDRVVFVHFDAVTLADERVFVAEAPASTDVGARFFDETVARMEEMLAEEATQAGSSRPWRTDFFYDSADGGTVIVLVVGESGLFEVQYQVETYARTVSRRQLRRASSRRGHDEEREDDDD